MAPGMYRIFCFVCLLSVNISARDVLDLTTESISTNHYQEEESTCSFLKQKMGGEF